jgi:hypothetical protein
VRAFARRRHGIATSLDHAEAVLLQSLATQLTAMLAPLAAEPGIPLPGLVMGGSTSAPADSALARLLPDAYVGADASSREAARDYRALTERGLATRKAAHAAVVMATAVEGDVLLSEDEAQAWLRTLADLRLVIADRLGLADEHSAAADADAETLAEVYEWLAWAQDTLVRAVDR